MPPEGAGGGDPGQFLGEDFAGGVGVNEGLDAAFVGQGQEAGAGFAGVGERAEDDVEADGSLLDGGLGEAGDLEKAAGDGGIASGVEGGGRFGLIGGDGRVGFEVSARADGDFDVVEGALGFDDAVPVKGRAGFGEGGDSAGKFAAVSAGLQGRDGVAVEHEPEAEVEDQREECEGCADSAARAFAAGANFFGDEAGEEGEKDSGEEDGEDPEVEGGEPVEGEAARGERPEELDAGGLAGVEGEMKEGCGESGGKDGSARDWVFG